MKRTLGAFAAATLGMALVASTHPTRADVITEWDEKGTAFVTPLMASWGGPNMPQRAMTMVHVAMFDAVNAIEPRYRPFLAQAAAPPSASKEAAAAVAAGTVLLSLVPADSKTGADIRAALAAYLEAIAPGDAKTLGIKVGQEAANSDFLLEHGAAAKANSIEDLPFRIEQLLGSKKLSDMAKAAKGLGRPQAAREICRLCCRLLGE